MLSWILLSLLVGCGGIAMAAFSAPQASGDARKWWQLTAVVAVVAVVLNGLFYIVQLRTAGYSPLLRDLVAAALLSAGFTFIVAAFGRWLSSRTLSAATQSLACYVVAITLSLPLPLLQLLVHCTSGDCL